MQAFTFKIRFLIYLTTQNAQCKFTYYMCFLINKLNYREKGEEETTWFEL